MTSAMLHVNNLRARGRVLPPDLMTGGPLMEFLVLGFLILAVAVVIAILSGHPIEWAREEWRSLWADTYELRAGITGGTLEEPRVKAMDTKMRAFAKRMRRDGRHLISGKHYIPVLTKPADPLPPKAGKVVPIFKPTRTKE